MSERVEVIDRRMREEGRTLTGKSTVVDNFYLDKDFKIEAVAIGKHVKGKKMNKEWCIVDDTNKRERRDVVDNKVKV